ncbi:hypothetical protein [Parabacteroides gordonii]|nr:hypothetical protein [Parabacteroides gordonii]MCA5585374.1 hypothetical protein [Parabacteroides gordonii]
MKRRGVSFRQTAPYEWQWFVEDNNAGFMENDILEVSITVDDPEFIRKISLKEDYNLLQLYQIRLGKESTIEFNPLPVPDKTKHQGEFCRVVLKPIQATITKLFSLQQTIQTLQTMLDESENDTSQLETIKLLGQMWEEIEWLPTKPDQRYTIKFCSSSYYWEFLFVFKDKTEKDTPIRSLVLESNAHKNKIIFDTSEKYENSMLGNNVYRVISEVKIETKKCYDFTLTLYERLSDDKRIVISKFIPVPQLGKYIASRPDIIREVCYL